MYFNVHILMLLWFLYLKSRINNDLPFLLLVPLLPSIAIYRCCEHVTNVITVDFEILLRDYKNACICCRRGKARTQVMLMPRAVQRGEVKPTKSSGPTGKSSTSAEPHSSGDTSNTSLSNADFRKMLLKWKSWLDFEFICLRGNKGWFQDIIWTLVFKRSSRCIVKFKWNCIVLVMENQLFFFFFFLNKARQLGGFRGRCTELLCAYNFCASVLQNASVRLCRRKCMCLKNKLIS